jgi:hypothetical protein
MEEKPCPLRTRGTGPVWLPSPGEGAQLAEAPYDGFWVRQSISWWLAPISVLDLPYEPHEERPVRGGGGIGLECNLDGSSNGEVLGLHRADCDVVAQLVHVVPRPAEQASFGRTEGGGHANIEPPAIKEAGRICTWSLSTVGNEGQFQPLGKRKTVRIAKVGTECETRRGI